MKRKFIFCYLNKDTSGIYRDMTKESSERLIEFLPSHKQYNSKIGEYAMSALLSSKFQNLPITKYIQNFYSNLESYEYSDNCEYFILIPSTSISKLSIEYIEQFHTNHINVKLFPVLTDSMHASSPHMKYVRNKLFSKAWEKVLTFDKNDAEEYGFTWFGYTWYSAFGEVIPSSKTSDLFFIGYKKGNRESIITDVYNRAILNNVNCDFRVVSKIKGRIRPESSLMYETSRYSYTEIVSLVKSTNCLLEILQEGQDTQTIKYYEAIAYNKKLLTTNKHVSDLPFYNSNNMKYFEKVEDIDWDWVIAKDEINYCYDNRFSPLKIIDFIQDIYPFD